MKGIIERITQMEKYFDTIQETVRTNPKRFCEDAGLQMMWKILTEYYKNGQWLADFECDERGELPTDLKRGILSEDAMYNLFSEIESWVTVQSSTNHFADRCEENK